MRWVVTGPAGAGKSLVTGLMREMGAVTVDGDRLGHEILARPGIVRAIAERFGAETIDGSGAVDRRRLGGRVFAVPAEMAALNAIVHPPLCELMENRLDELEGGSERALAVLEAAVYFLLPQPPRADLVIAVTAASALRRERLIAGGLDPGRAADRIAGQRAMEKDFARADVTIHNEGTRDDLAARVRELIGLHGPDAPLRPRTGTKDGTA